MKRLLLGLLLVLIAASASALPAVDAGYVAVHNAIRIRYTIAGLPEATTCTLTLKSNVGAIVGTITSPGQGVLPRWEMFTGLTPGTNFGITIDCGVEYEIVNNQLVSTMVAPAASTVAVPIQHATPKTYVGAARATVVYGDTTALGSSAQNTSCTGACTITPTFNKGFQFYGVQTQNASDVILGQTRTAMVVIGDSTSANLTSGGTTGGGGGGDSVVPRLATWEANFTYYDCSRYVHDTLLFGTYYDGIFAMELIRAYRIAHGAAAPEIAQWDTCVATALSVYRDGYVLPNQGGVTGYDEFTHGLKANYDRTGSVDSFHGVVWQAGWHLVDLIGKGASYCGAGGGTDYNVVGVLKQRETAYCMRSILDAELVGGPVQLTKRNTVLNNMKIQTAKRIGTRANPTPQVLPSDEVPMGYCPASVPPGSNWYVQPFMLAIQAHSYIQYYEQISQDADIVDTLTWMADWMIAESWQPAYKAFWYANCRVYGGATWGSTATWSNPGANDLALMFVDIFEWLYRKTCNITYRTYADAMFDEGVRNGASYLGYDGKHFNQNYAQGSFEYVRMRQLPAPTCTTAMMALGKQKMPKMVAPKAKKKK